MITVLNAVAHGWSFRQKNKNKDTLISVATH